MNSVIDTPVNTTTNDNTIATDVKKKEVEKRRKIVLRLQKNQKFLKNVDANQKEASLLMLL